MRLCINLQVMSSTTLAPASGLAEGVTITAKTHQPASVKPFHIIDGPTVWYGQDLTPEVRNDTLQKGCLSQEKFKHSKLA